MRSDYDMCYAYISHNTTWAEAEAACKSLGGWLGEPRTLQENDFFEKIMFEHRGYAVWLGGHDRDKEGDWRWEHAGVPLKDGFTFWGMDEPNDTFHLEDCLVFYYETGQWNDMPCFLEQHFVCEKPADASSIAPVPVVG